MLFVVTARLAEGPEAEEKRATLRPAHMKTVRAMAADGRMVLGGALMDGEKSGPASFAILDLPDRAALDAWLAGHPYRTNGVWADVAVATLSPAAVFDPDARGK